MEDVQNEVEYKLEQLQKSISKAKQSLSDALITENYEVINADTIALKELEKTEAKLLEKYNLQKQRIKESPAERRRMTQESAERKGNSRKGGSKIKVKKPLAKPVKKPVKKPLKKPVKKPVKIPVVKAVKKPVKKPVVKSTQKKVATTRVLKLKTIKLF